MRLITLFCLLFIVSCGDPIDPKDYMPDAVGKSGEIQVLMETDLWNGPVGKTIQAHFDNYAKGVYLRPEPTFNYYQIKPTQFTGSLRSTRNVLQVKLRADTTYSKTTITEYHDRYAKGQLFIQVADSDPLRLLESIRQDMYTVINTFNEKEQERLVKIYNTNYNAGINEEAEKNMAVSIHLPELSELKVNEPGFMWIKHDRSKTQIAGQENKFEAGTYWIQQGFIIWETPYSDTAQLSIAGILKDRDSTLKYHVPGKVEGSYMATEYDPLYSPEGKVYQHNGAYAVKIYGLWKHAGDVPAFGGGPFVQTTIHNEKRQSLITFCGYVYAPKFDKREYIREIEAMIATLILK